VMQAPLLESVYDWPLVISRDPAIGSPSLVPLRRRSISHINQPLK
jgi:iron complex transport system ATP-binding protein